MDNSLPPVDVPNAFDIYEDVDYRLYWQSLSRRKLDELERAILRELLPPRGSAVIDLGCGYGRLFPCYADRFEHIVLFDGSESLLRQAQSSHRERALYVLGDINRLPFRPAAFDAVVMVRVFHHLNRPDQVMKSIAGILCRDGALVFNYSNKRNLLQMLKYRLGRTKHNPFSPEPLTVEANFFHHHPASVSGLLAGLGFQKLIHRGAGVFDKLAPILGPLSRFSPAGMSLAPWLGRTALAPWIFCKAQLPDAPPQAAAGHPEELLACPVCGGAVKRRGSVLACAACPQEYPVRDGIVDMRTQRT
ncbi:MAG: hypothetical protein DPW18_03015 [Chloroflexi bacterium]|nr:hypothetical protein [Chloroflexota bacterium]MDL1943054.1 methyltransferase domain-containing protein [Chloroflexi bacterium CFX2]